MKRLLCILSNMNAGGAETFLMKLYRQIDRSMYQLDFCINEKEKCFYEDEIFDFGGKIYRIPTKSENYREYKKQLFQVVSDNGYKYVLRIASNGASFLDVKIAKQAGAEMCSVRSSNSSDGKGIKTKLAHRIGRLLYSKYIDVSIAPSDLAASYTFGKQAYLKGDVNILHNAIDLNKFNYCNQKRIHVRKEFNIQEHDLIIGHIGRFMHQKNHSFLVDVFEEIYFHNRNAKLLLVGNGELEENVRKKVSMLGLNDAVIFAGVRNDIPDILSAMDVFVFPSLYEGMPNTVIEAQATGLPCVISDSITTQADITGLVKFVSLDNSIAEWVKEINSCASLDRANTRECFIKNKYDINSTVNEFVKLVFR